jgi:magnesium transporter
MHTALRRVHTSNVMRLSRTSSAPQLIAQCRPYQSHALLTSPSSPQQRAIPHNALLVSGRHFHLASLKNFFRPKGHESSGLSDTQEEIAKAAILEKVMKGRQLTDLMLRCTFSPIRLSLFRFSFLQLTEAQALSWTMRVPCRFLSLSSRCITTPVALGNIKSISGQFKRSDLCSEHRLNVRKIVSIVQNLGWTLTETLMKPRDLRKIDSRIPNLVPTILIRKGAVLVRCCV